MANSTTTIEGLHGKIRDVNAKLDELQQELQELSVVPSSAGDKLRETLSFLHTIVYYVDMNREDRPQYTCGFSDEDESAAKLVPSDKKTYRELYAFMGISDEDMKEIQILNDEGRRIRRNLDDNFEDLVYFSAMLKDGRFLEIYPKSL